MKQNSLKLFSLILVLSIPNFIWAQNAPCEEECSEGVRVEKVEIEDRVPEEVLDVLLENSVTVEPSTEPICTMPDRESLMHQRVNCEEWTPSGSIASPSYLGFRSNQDDFTTRTVFTREDIQRMNRYD